MKIFPIYSLVTLLLANPTFAGFEDAVAAYKNGQHQEALSIWKIAAKQGETQSLRLLCSIYHDGMGIIYTDYEQAMIWCGLAAQKGIKEAQYTLGLMFDNGRGVQSNYSAAANWYLQSANQNYAPAQINLGLLYINGQGAPKDLKKAFNLFEKAAKQNQPQAQYNVGLMYLHGTAVKRNFTQAAKWFLLAAEQGDEMARLNLSTLYAHGQGVPKNNVIAYAILLTISDARGMPYGEVDHKKEIIKNISTTDQIDAAELLYDKMMESGNFAESIKNYQQKSTLHKIN